MSASKRRGKTDAKSLQKSLLAIHRWKLSAIKPRFSKLSKAKQKALHADSWRELNAVIAMGKQLRAEFVDGKEQLLPGERCPRCLQRQHRIRRHKAFTTEKGDAYIYSCMECKQVITFEIEGLGSALDTNADTKARGGERAEELPTQNRGGTNGKGKTV